MPGRVENDLGQFQADRQLVQTLTVVTDQHRYHAEKAFAALQMQLSIAQILDQIMFYVRSFVLGQSYAERHGVRLRAASNDERARLLALQHLRDFGSLQIGEQPNRVRPDQPLQQRDGGRHGDQTRCCGRFGSIALVGFICKISC